MSLNTLPAEIKHQIVQDATPDGFEGIALTCKSFFDVSQPLIHEYNRKKRRFGSFRYSRHSADADCDAPGDKTTCTDLDHWDDTTAATGEIITDVFGLLALVLRNPDIGRFIHSLDLKHPRVLLPFDDRMAGLGFAHIAATNINVGFGAHGLDPVVLGNRGPGGIRGPSPHWDEEDEANLRRFLSHPIFGEEEEVLEDASTYDLDTVSIVEAEIWLLNLLPNVKEIALSKAWAYEIPPNRMKELERIAKRANDPEIPNASLSQLTVMKPFVGHGYVSVTPLSHFTPFLSLKSLKEFYMGGVKAWGTNPVECYFDTKSLTLGDGLTKIELNGSCIGIPELSDLLDLTPNLKSLSLGLETKPNSAGRSYDIGRMISVIGSQIGNVIEELAIVNHPMHWATTSPASMSDFQRLKSFEIEAQLDTYEDNFVTLPLVDMLPPSLETTKLYSRDLAREGEVVANMTKLLRGFRDERPTKLPKLVEIDLISPLLGISRGSRELSAATRIAAEAGVRVQHPDMRQCISKFTRTFNSRFGVTDAEVDNRPDIILP
ncbi:unnamed protein product [Clonostachys rosea]|uniref:F-box domain-containing protein n=1 Tax=Bionectria ochroleuca TaxID=29856 RepID=A0ABY6V215_BIOOC|nr:unnamed protein product [Clonostachys rosea]